MHEEETWRFRLACLRKLSDKHLSSLDSPCTVTVL